MNKLILAIPAVICILSFSCISTGPGITDPLELVEAVRNGDEVKTEKLLRRNISPDITDSFGRKALSLAALNGEYDIVVILIKACANVDMKDSAGRTLLIYSTWAGKNSWKIARVLLDAGTDPDEADNDGRTALISAVFRENTTSYPSLSEKGWIKIRVTKTGIPL
jgi:ankyrin repeat protein